MTKKDYVKFATVINEQRELAETQMANDRDYEEYSQGQLNLLENLIEELCVIFEEDNPSFDEDRFREACGV